MDPQQGPSQPDLLIGQTIGNYQVTQKLGEGGMGAVYLAEHPAIGKKVALKVLHSEYSNNEEVAQRFFHEAKAVNNIGHPNIVDIVDYGVLQSGAAGREQLVYFIMEYLSGHTLTQLLRAEAPLPPERAFAIAMQVADALAASHKCNIVHRDLKPDNIMLEQRGRERDFVKLLDFGIAKLTDAKGGGSRTRTGLVMGTPAYMSPEQCEGRATVDHRTDIYALGIVVYEMLVGRVPFVGDGYGEILVQHLTQHPVPPSQYRMLPPHVEMVVLKALEKRPDLRYPTMDEMMRAMADPVGYVEANGGVGGFLQRQLMPSTAPLPPVRMTPAPFTPAPGSLTAPSGIWGSGGPQAPTTLGAAAGQVQPKKSKTGFLIAALLILAAAGAGIAIVVTGDKVESGGETVAGNDPGSDTAGSATTGSATTPDTGSGSATAEAGSAGSADPGAGSGSATAEAGSGAGSAVTTPPPPTMSKIVLTTKPAGAAIFVDGVDTGKVTPEPFEVDRSKQAVTVTLKLDRYHDLELKNFSVADDVTVKYTLKKKPVVHTGRNGNTTNNNTGRGSNAGRGSGSGSTIKNDTGLMRPD